MRAAALALLVTVGGCGRSPIRVASESMMPTLAPGDILFPVPISNPATDLRRGRIVVYEWFEGVLFSEPGALLAFRIVALPGDRISLRSDTLRVNGSAVREPYAHYSLPAGMTETAARPPQSEIPETVVPPGTVYVLGDNRLNAVDSRYHGPVPIERVRAYVEP